MRGPSGALHRHRGLGCGACSCAPSDHSKRILRKYSYPPDLRDSAAQTVLDQAKLLAADWAS
ncbi:MAG: DUF3387 domain-containing protein [Anaerolineae bacterium]|nr:DUF3387 domain-containing protein [Anaerolineae bacterium]